MNGTHVDLVLILVLILVLDWLGQCGGFLCLKVCPRSSRCEAHF
jgi:hypothetical protein